MAENEYIKREALALKVRRHLMPNVDIDGTVSVEDAERYFLKLLDEQPTADVVEVVRCKDCGMSRETEDERYRFCMQFRDTVDNEAFCSYGEKTTMPRCADIECEPPCGNKEDCELYKNGYCSAKMDGSTSIHS